MSATVGYDEGVRLRRAEDEWLHHTTERLRRASNRPSPPAPGRRGDAPAAGEGDER